MVRGMVERGDRRVAQDLTRLDSATGSGQEWTPLRTCLRVKRIGMFKLYCQHWTAVERCAGNTSTVVKLQLGFVTGASECFASCASSSEVPNRSTSAGSATHTGQLLLSCVNAEMQGRPYARFRTNETNTYLMFVTDDSRKTGGKGRKRG